MKKPLIGITLDSEEHGGYSKFPWYAIRKNYLEAVDKYGGLPFPIFHSIKNIKNIIKLLDGLIITGGNFDISPSIYGKKTLNSRNKKKNRTKFELNLFKSCLKKNIPILGICGGEQLINVALGGTLIQHIQSKEISHEQLTPRNRTSHDVTIKTNTKIYSIINKSVIKVNSAHHQAVDKIGKNLIVTGKSSDGCIEAIEHINHKWCLGLQWHPEFLITNYDKLIIKDFIKNTM